MFGLGRSKKKKKKTNDPQKAVAEGDYPRAAALYRARALKDPRRAANWHKKAAEMLALAGSKNEAVSEYLEAALRFEKEERMLQVVALYKAALRLDPQNPELRERLARIATSEEERRAARSGDAAAMTIRTRLRRYAPLFSEFTREELTAVVDIMQLRRVTAGTTIFSQGAEGDSLFIVAQGEVALSVRVERAGRQGQREVARVGDGGFFGEVSALRRIGRDVSAVATRPSELLELERDYLEALAIAHPQVWEVLERFQRERATPVGV